MDLGLYPFNAHINLSLGELGVDVQGEETAKNCSQVPTENDQCVFVRIRVEMPFLETNLGTADTPPNVNATDQHHHVG